MLMNPKLDTQKTAKQASLWSQLPLSLSVAAAVAALSCSVAAQSLLEEVVVTAQKRDQGLQATSPIYRCASVGAVERNLRRALKDGSASSNGLKDLVKRHRQPKPRVARAPRA